MDLSVFAKKDFISQQRIRSIKALRCNKNPNVISVVAFLGGSDCRQGEPYSRAISRLSAYYKPKGILIDYHPLTNTMVKELGWTTTQTIDSMLTGDLHSIPTHFHQGNQTACRKSFNIFNINKNLDRLQYHVGVPCGKNVFCSIWRQDKWTLCDLLMSLNLCAPTMPVDLTADCFSDPHVIDNISR